MPAATIFIQHCARGPKQGWNTIKIVMVVRFPK